MSETKKRREKRQPVVRQWSVPFEITMRGSLTVEAATQDEAEEMADRYEGEFEFSTAETIDWRREGTAKDDSP